MSSSPEPHGASPPSADRVVLPQLRRTSSAHDHIVERIPRINIGHQVVPDLQSARHTPTLHADRVAELAKASATLHSPVQRMPPEILGIIFENCLPVDEFSRAVLSQSPLLLGRVCSHWRQVCLSTPRLWTSLSFHFLETDLDRTQDEKRVTRALDTWLQRSSPVPLSISFTDHRIFQKETEVLIIWLLLQIRDNCALWKDIYLQFSSDYFIQLSALSPCEFTSLESLSVHADHMGWRRGLISLSLDLTLADRLKSLSYTGPDRVVREELLADWTRLTEMSFQYDLHEAGGESSTLSRHFGTLRLCQNLTVFSVGIGHPFHFYPDDFIVLPCLHTLKIRRLSRRSHARTIVDALILPQLETLDIDSAILVGWDGWNMRWHGRQFSDMLRRSACKLKGLHIRDVDFPNEELMRCLANAPTLTSFSFLPCPRSQPIGDLVDYLYNGPKDAPNAPARHFADLQKIRLGCAHEAYFTPLAGMVESRSGAGAARAGVTRLLDFELVFYDFMHDNHALRRVYLDNFKKRLMHCADDDGKMIVGVRVEVPYNPAYITIREDGGHATI
ncbi:hypothetical protein HYDPIDRAFT_118134 [Hydnomerulius pinastri MD-312]|uniref:F-box domain-containing protein n=1 Tax=Hydnomerulius pinastri MD-312 TaxID=994086 RepID=A0A0C9W9V9_9AGAM|nr:hypothetical protein HYDPIDRAFT_118134 [Hydnomerulius pinastri MD-312]